MAEEAKTAGGAGNPRRNSTRKAWAWILGPVAAFCLLVVLVLATGQPSADAVVKDAATSFSQVKRGNFQMAMTITPQGGSNEAASAIELSGPFEIVPGKKLPRARITYTISSGGRSQEVTLLMTGDKAYSLIKGQAYELPPTATKQLESATKDLSKGSKGKQQGLSGLKLNFDKWLEDPQVKDGPTIDGTPTWRTAASVNVIAALQDLTGSLGALSSVTGQTVPAVKKSQIAAINKQIKGARVVVYVGKYDGIMRLMNLTMFFKTPADAAAATGGITGGSMNLRVGISEPNQSVDVSPPNNPLPYSALQSLVNSQSSQTGTTLDDGLGK